MEELIQGDLGYLVQDFVNSPTQISKFLGLGEVYTPTVPATDQIGTWGFLQIKEDVKLHILSGRCHYWRSSWAFGAGVWVFSHTNFEIIALGGTL